MGTQQGLVPPSIIQSAVGSEVIVGLDRGDPGEHGTSKHEKS